MFVTYILLLTSLVSLTMSRVQKRHIDFRERFLERKRDRILKVDPVKNTEVIDEITHYRKIKDKSKKWKRITAIEVDFRRLLAMESMKYNYKRDYYWRTWRAVIGINGDEEIISYKCHNPIRLNGSECHNCGMWTIEEKPPPCPYEFFSLQSNDALCGATYNQYKIVNNTCPSVIKFYDLTATCDNPIETEWHFTKMYGVGKHSDSVICANKDVCEMLTLYEISPEHVIFRIINSTNDVMYSRIMKPNNTNYICIDDCGRFNPNTRKVSKIDKPMRLDLLTPRITRDDRLEQGMALPTEATLIGLKKRSTSLSVSKIGGNFDRFRMNKNSQQNMNFKVMQLNDNNNIHLKNNLVRKRDLLVKPKVTLCQKLKIRYEQTLNSYQNENEDVF